MAEQRYQAVLAVISDGLCTTIAATLGVSRATVYRMLANAVGGGNGTTMLDEGERRRLKVLLDDEIKACTRCEGLNIKGETQAAPGWGNVNSPVAIVGQSLCQQCMERQEPFYEGSESLLTMSFDIAGCQKADTFVTNAVHCHPPGNRKSHNHEIVNCSSYLYREIEIVRPRLVIGLGADAARVLSFFYPSARKVASPFSAPKNVRSKTVPCLHFVDHPSYVKRQHNTALETAYVNDLAAALKWAFAKGSRWGKAEPRIEPTCKGMIPSSVERRSKPDHSAQEGLT